MDFTLPSNGKVLTWDRLNYGDELDLRATYAREDMRHLFGPSLLAKRIKTFDGKTANFTWSDLRTWDPLDVEMFTEEVDLDEATRRAALRRKSSNIGQQQAFDAAVEGFRAALIQVSITLGAVQEQAKAAAVNVPLASGQT